MYFHGREFGDCQEEAEWHRKTCTQTLPLHFLQVFLFVVSLFVYIYNIHNHMPYGSCKMFLKISSVVLRWVSSSTKMTNTEELRMKNHLVVYCLPTPVLILRNSCLLPFGYFPLMVSSVYEFS